jgi:hypothetical protein
MAVKKTTKKKDESAAPTKAEAKETAPKKAPKKAKAPEAATTPAPAPAAAAPTPAKKAAPKKAAAPIKLSASQGELLKKISEAPETGYAVAKKVEERSIESLLLKKLIKKGAKDKASGTLRYHISSAGKKHLSTP